MSLKSFHHSRQWRLFLRIFQWFRWTCLLLLMFFAYQLVVWNRNYDPRFYHFLSTGPGRTLARVMKWPTFYNQDPHDKPESQFTAAELSWKRRLEAQLRDAWPTHVLRMMNGDEHLVRIMHETPTHVTISESFGGQGRVMKDVDRREVLSLKPHSQPMPTVSWRDVRFQMEFPNFQLIHFGHYTVLTDAPYYQVLASVRELEHMHGQYMELLGGLIRHQAKGHTLQVLFFSDEQKYRAHQQDSAPDLETSAGFYSPLTDRMVVFNQYHSIQARNMREEIQEEIRNMMLRADSQHERRALEDMRQSVEEQLRLRGQRETIATLRHEGAHHLSYTYGVHSWFHAENGWLIEGLAVHFETDPPGRLGPSHRQTLLRLLAENRIPPLPQLMNIRKPEDFQIDLPGYASYEAYAFSWVLFDLAMQPQYQEHFFDYLRYIRNPDNIRNLVRTPREVILAEHLQMTPDELERAWQRHMRQLLRNAAS